MVVRVIRHPQPEPRTWSLRTALVALLTAFLLAVPVVGQAHADTFDDIYADYRNTQTIDPCKYTKGELEDAKSRLGSDSDQYAPEFPDALDAAIAASGDCKKASDSKPSSGGGTPSTRSSGPTSTQPQQTTTTTTTTETTTSAVAPPSTTPGPAAVAQPSAAAQDGVITARAATPDDNDPEAWTWAVLAAAIIGAAALGWAFVNATGRIQWLTPLGHSMGEAGWRISLRWAEFRDWMRFGSGR
ncbi:hypothetical protein [Patulibacter minatonensis]|uniref:hypothetical protein n=1 Tax=Patulibacter minatonensis TaxID=298163 RepID=UPI00047A9257|nr:hypothetical protein [Patulibacter minatonensis]